MENEDNVFCFGWIRLHHRQKKIKSVEDEPIDDVVDRLTELAKAQWYHIDGLRHDIEEAQKNAVYYSKVDMQEARMHTSLSMEYARVKERELEKYKQMKLVVSKLQEARRNVGIASAYFASSKTLQEVINATPEISDVMDDLRDLFGVVDEHSTLLSEPLRQEEEEVSPHGAERRFAEEERELVLPSVPLLKKEQPMTRKTLLKE